MKHKYKLAYLKMAKVFAETSEALRLKVCAMLVKEDRIISIGINGQPPGWPYEKCEDDNFETLPTVRHAEDACLQKLWSSSEIATGSTMFVTHSPCLQCAIKIVTAGIHKVVYIEDFRCDDGLKYLQDNGVKIEKIKL